MQVTTGFNFGVQGGGRELPFSLDGYPIDDPSTEFAKTLRNLSSKAVKKFVITENTGEAPAEIREPTNRGFLRASSGPNNGVYALPSNSSSLRVLWLISKGITHPQLYHRFEAMATSNSGTAMRFKPRFPTEAHRAGWRKKAIEGIANLMPSGGLDPRPSMDPMSIGAIKKIAQVGKDESETSY